MPCAPAVQPGPGPAPLKLHAESPRPHTTATCPGPGGLVTPLGHTGPTPQAATVPKFAWLTPEAQKGPLPHAASVSGFTLPTPPGQGSGTSRPHTTASWSGPGGLVTPVAHTGPTPQAAIVLALALLTPEAQNGPSPQAASVSAFAPCGHGFGTHVASLFTRMPGWPAWQGDPVTVPAQKGTSPSTPAGSYSMTMPSWPG
jgi:hypothetical protein